MNLHHPKAELTERAKTTKTIRPLFEGRRHSFSPLWNFFFFFTPLGLIHDWILSFDIDYWSENLAPDDIITCVLILLTDYRIIVLRNPFNKVERPEVEGVHILSPATEKVK